MQYNECKICGAKDGRAGMLIGNACLNCHDTRTTGEIVVHLNLVRTDEELKKTFALLKNKQRI